MSSDPQVQLLLDELFDTRRTPEEVCIAYPHLLPEVRERWHKIRLFQADLDAMFPPAVETGVSAQAPPKHMTALPQIPGYEVQSVLGRGGMGIVFRARHVRLNRLVALKMVLVGEYAGPQEKLRFQREAEAVAALRNPNIVQIHDIGDADGRPYFTMEFVEGGSLAQKLAGSPQPARTAATLLATLAAAVQAAHTCDIVHRDLKPGNILLTIDGTPKITDFGLARRLDGETALTRTGIAVGTPSYMAPEQARGDKLIGLAVDVYALGAILYELLTGRPPFLAETAAETIHQVITQDPVPPSRLNSTVPRDLATICLNCLHKDPGRRYVTAGALAEDLHRFLRGEAITARPEGRWARLVRRIRRRKALTAAVAVSVLLAFALVGGIAWNLSDREAAARAAQAEDATTERAADDDLKEMATFLKESKWSEAKAALERAKGRRGERASDQLRARLHRSARDLKLALMLEVLSLHASAEVDGVVAFAQTDAEYETAFREYDYARPFEDPEAVAERIASSNIPSALVAALDRWGMITKEPRRQSWAMAVARAAARRQPDSDPTGWRDRARDLEVWKNEAAFAKLVKEAQFARQSVALLLAVAQHLNATGKNPIPFLKQIQEAHPGDFWANVALGQVLVHTHSYQESMRYMQAALAIRPDAAVSHNFLGLALYGLDRKAEAIEQYRISVGIEPAPLAHRRLAMALSEKGPFDEAIDQCRLALVYFAEDAPLRVGFGRCLEATGRNDDAVVQFSMAVKLDPNSAEGYMGLRLVYGRQKRFMEALKAWGNALETTPPLAHSFWYGYAEKCLFYGQVDEYRRHRKFLLKAFADAKDPYIAERTSRACLLMPATGDELLQAAALADRAVSFDKTKYPPGAFPYFLFVKGLAQYRQAQFKEAIATMQGDASRVAGPNTRLVLAMALFRDRQLAEALKKLTEAILSYDWRPAKVVDQDGEIRHLLRREAESNILSAAKLNAFIEGKYHPRDNDERLVLVGVCQFGTLNVALSRLYADAFDADPKLAQDFRSGHRFKAACAAAQAGFGLGNDAFKLSQPEREKSRTQARQWLRADLADWRNLLDDNSGKAPIRDLVRQRLTQWQGDPDLAGLREAAELAKLPAEERQDCVALWDEVGRVVKANQAK
jgi:serine/threonine-protein kinase